MGQSARVAVPDCWRGTGVTRISLETIMAAYKYHAKNLPTLYRTNRQAPCLVCGAVSKCKSNFDRTVYLCHCVPSDNPIGDPTGWVHRIPPPTSAEYFDRFLAPSHGYWSPRVGASLQAGLGVTAAELTTYPIRIDPIHRLGVLPTIDWPSTPVGVHLVNPSGPGKATRFMLKRSQAGPAFPTHHRGGMWWSELACVVELEDALVAEAHGLSTCLLGTPYVTADMAASVGQYAQAGGFSTVVLVDRSDSPLLDQKVAKRAADKLHTATGGMEVQAALMPDGVATMRDWIAAGGVSTSGGFMGARVIRWRGP